jgi:hypothetical protein
MSWDGDAPWLDTQDLQGFDNGALVAVRPLRVEAKFDGPSTGGKLSDHDGYEVTYRLSWPRDSSSLRTAATDGAKLSGTMVCAPTRRA